MAVFTLDYPFFWTVVIAEFCCIPVLFHFLPRKTTLRMIQENLLTQGITGIKWSHACLWRESRPRTSILKKLQSCTIRAVRLPSKGEPEICPPPVSFLLYNVWQCGVIVHRRFYRENDDYKPEEGTVNAAILQGPG